MMNKYLRDIENTVSELDTGKLVQIVEKLREVRDNRRWVFTFGNGGSGATASHLAGDLSKSCGLKTHCLNDSSPNMTAWANDADYRVVFERQLIGVAERGDVLIAISGSGNSQNVIRAFKLAKENGIYTIGLTAFDGGALKSIANLAMVVPIKNMEQAEDIHLMICHIIKTSLVVK
jgi:D-sedoheptulose 7-phosphate isomerase